MFNQIFVSYLTQKNLLTPEQAAEVLEVQKNTRIRVGVLAVEENLMTVKQVELVNRLQASQNARFGDIAIQKGYLTKEQLELLLGKQPREHIILKQILCDKEYMDSSRIDSALDEFKSFINATDKEFELLQDNDAGTYVSCIAKISGDNFILSEYAKLFITTTLRLIDREIFVKKAFKARLDSLKYVAMQKCIGDDSLAFVFSAADTGSAIKFAENYSKFSFDSLDEDAQDSLKEFLNCVDGLLISELSNSGKMELDIEVPEYFDELSLEGEIVVLPFSLSIGEFYISIYKEV